MRILAEENVRIAGVLLLSVYGNADDDGDDQS